MLCYEFCTLAQSLFTARIKPCDIIPIAISVLNVCVCLSFIISNGNFTILFRKIRTQRLIRNHG